MSYIKLKMLPQNENIFPLVALPTVQPILTLSISFKTYLIIYFLQCCLKPFFYSLQALWPHLYLPARKINQRILKITGFSSEDPRSFPEKLERRFSEPKTPSPKPERIRLRTIRWELYIFPMINRRKSLIRPESLARRCRSGFPSHIADKSLPLAPRNSNSARRQVAMPRDGLSRSRDDLG